MTDPATDVAYKPDVIERLSGGTCRPAYTHSRLRVVEPGTYGAVGKTGQWVIYFIPQDGPTFDVTDRAAGPIDDTAVADQLAAEMTRDLDMVRHWRRGLPPAAQDELDRLMLDLSPASAATLPTPDLSDPTALLRRNA